MIEVVVARRPGAGVPRPYAFPAVTHDRLANGMALALVHMPRRPLLSATLLLPLGAVDERAAEAGATVLMARALSEGTIRRDAVAFTEATERLGASIHAEAGWDALSAGLDVPAPRLAAALELLAEMVAQPAFPEREVERLREERLNDLLQARADPRRRADEAFAAAVYAASSPYQRPSAGTRDTVQELDAAMVRALHARRFDPSRMTFVVGGDLTGIDVARLAAARFGGWSPTAATQAETTGAIDDRPAERHRRIVVVHRPGSVQTEIRVGHPGLPRRIAGYHAVVIMAAILGGLFNSRLNRRLREEKGYTYGAAASFDFRRAAGPFAARAAVDTAVTVPALVDMLAELVAIGERRVTDDELRVARDYLVGVFPLRFETPGAVVGALTGLAVHGLDEGELVRYRAAVEAVTADDVQAAARAHVRPDEAAIVLVGDADAFLPALEAAGLGSVTVQREPVEMMAGAADGEPGPEPDGGAGAE